MVSNKLSQGDIKSLNGLVTSDIMPNLHKTVSLMSLSDREQIAINSDDIYFSFPYQVLALLYLNLGPITGECFFYFRSVLYLKTRIRTT